MRLLTPKVMLVGALLVLLIAAAGGYSVAREIGVLIAILVTQGVVIVLAVVVWRQSDQAMASRVSRVERVLERHEEGRTLLERLLEQLLERLLQQQESQSLAHQEFAHRLEEFLDAERRHHGATAHTVSEAARQLQAGQSASTERLSRDVQRVQDLVKRRTESASKERVRALRAEYRQLEALGGLYARLRPDDAFPATRSWVASPDMLLYLAGLVRREAPSFVLECGSGLSTVVFAYALRELGSGRVIALEHLEEYREATEQLLADHGVAEWAEVRAAPLEPVELEDEEWPWYDVDAVPDEPLDLVLVDGPPGHTRDHARYPAGPLLLPKLAPGGCLVLDDYARDEERECGERWVEQFPGLEVEVLQHEKGTAVFRWSTGDDAGSPDSQSTA